MSNKLTLINPDNIMEEVDEFNTFKEINTISPKLVKVSFNDNIIHEKVVDVNMNDSLIIESVEDVKIEKDLSQLLLDNINLPSYNLSSEQISWINQFIKASPNSFTQITTEIKTLTDSGKIGLQSIPQIVKLIGDIYKSGAINFKLVSSENIIVFIKYTLDILIDSPFLVITEFEKDVVKEIIDSSLILLKTNLDIESVIEKVESWDCYICKFFRIFK
jgi:hypothetical protein